MSPPILGKACDDGLDGIQWPFPEVWLGQGKAKEPLGGGERVWARVLAEARVAAGPIPAAQAWPPKQTGRPSPQFAARCMFRLRVRVSKLEVRVWELEKRLTRLAERDAQAAALVFACHPGVQGNQHQ